MVMQKRCLERNILLGPISLKHVRKTRIHLERNNHKVYKRFIPVRKARDIPASKKALSSREVAFINFFSLFTMYRIIVAAQLVMPKNMQKH